MTRWNSAMGSKFRHHRLIGVKEDPHRKRLLAMYDLDDDVHVGLYDGVDTWIALRANMVGFTRPTDEQIRHHEQGRNISHGTAQNAAAQDGLRRRARIRRRFID